MNKRVAKMWVRALRSNKYIQGRRALKQKLPEGVGHCCLGVLCELYNDSMKRLGKSKVSCRYTEDGYYLFSGQAEVLPKKVQAWAGLQYENGLFNGLFSDKKGENSLTEMNDNGCSFRKIAQVIERKVEEL